MVEVDATGWYIVFQNSNEGYKNCQRCLRELNNEILERGNQEVDRRSRIEWPPSRKFRIRKIKSQQGQSPNAQRQSGLRRCRRRPMTVTITEINMDQRQMLVKCPVSIVSNRDFYIDMNQRDRAAESGQSFVRVYFI